MHILGKILIWMIVIAAGAAIVLTSKVVTYRNSWTKKIEELQKSNAEKAQLVAEKERTLKLVREELSRTMLGWGNYWTDVEVAVQDGAVAARNFGTNLGFGLPAGPNLPVAYLFMPDGQEGSKYVGAFQPPDAGSLRENDVIVRPTWPARPEEEESWKRGAQQGPWRWRTRIPAGYVTRFSDLYADLNFADELLAARQRNLVLQNELYQVSEEHLNYRLQELLGPPDVELPGRDEKIDPYAIGLVKAIELEEVKRNRAQSRVDRLRRELKQAQQTLQELLDKNRELASRLAQPNANQTADRELSAVSRPRSTEKADR